MRALLYAPDLQGHPQIYCRVIAGALLRAGHTVVIASPSAKEDWRTAWPPLRPLADDSRVECEDVRAQSAAPGGGLTAEQLLAIQTRRRVDSTLFIEGDKFAEQFRRIAAGDAPRPRGRICAICDRAAAWYPGEDPYDGRREPRIGPTWRATLSRIRRGLLHRRQTARHYYEQVLLRRRTVDALIVKDERIAERFGPPVTWMPEIYRVFDPRPDERRGPDWERFADPIRAFVDRAGAGNVLLYFGAGAWYKGYDAFLRLAIADETTFALHAGAPPRHEPGKNYDLDVAAARQDLLRQGRWFETGAFVESTDLVELLFASIARFVSTHRLTLTSGTMLQALEQEKPVLTPDAGLVGWRTRTFQLGSVYRYGDPTALRDAWRSFRTGAFDPPVESLRRFMRKFSRSETERFFVGVLTGDRPP